MILRAPWTTWWQDNLPCRFSREDATKNCAFLVELLGRGWLQSALGPKTQHPLVSEWMTGGANAFLRLNALAEDSKLLVSVAGFHKNVLGDLRHRKRCLPGWHVVRVAAMFQRAGAAVTNFCQQTDKMVPDFSIRFDSIEANVEAKLLTTSDIEEAFQAYAAPMKDRIFAEALVGERLHPPVTVIVKNAECLPTVSEVVNSAKALLDRAPDELRTDLFNIFVGAPPSDITTTLFRQCYILCPRSQKENLRVESRVRDASHQLLSDSASNRPGIAWIGVTEHQDPLAIRDWLLRKFDEGRFSGISAAILSRSGTYFELPRRSVIDQWITISNSKGRFPLPRAVPFKPLDLGGPFGDIGLAGIPAYRVGAAETRVGSGGRGGVRLPDIRNIAPGLLE